MWSGVWLYTELTLSAARHLKGGSFLLFLVHLVEAVRERHEESLRGLPRILGRCHGREVNGRRLAAGG